MPELPEVETSRRGIEPFLLNRKIKKITIRQHKLRWPVPNNLAELATGKVIRAVSRRAKYIYLVLDNGTIIIQSIGSINTLSNQLIPLYIRHTNTRRILTVIKINH